MWVHLISFFVLFTTHLSDLFSNTYIHAKSKHKQDLKAAKTGAVVEAEAQESIQDK